MKIGQADIPTRRDVEEMMKNWKQDELNFLKTDMILLRRELTKIKEELKCLKN